MKSTWTPHLANFQFSVLFIYFSLCTGQPVRLSVGWSVSWAGVTRVSGPRSGGRPPACPGHHPPAGRTAGPATRYIYIILKLVSFLGGVDGGAGVLVLSGQPIRFFVKMSSVFRKPFFEVYVSYR